MARLARLTDLVFTVSTDADDTNVVDLGQGQAKIPVTRLCLATTEDAFTGTITVMFSMDNTTFYTATDIGFGANGVYGDVTVTAVDALWIKVMGRYIKLKSNGTEGDDATVMLFAVFE